MDQLARLSSLRATDYEAMLTAAVLRQLLVDGNALALLINRRFRMSLVFNVSTLQVRVECEPTSVLMQGPWLDQRLAELQFVFTDRFAPDAAKQFDSIERRKLAGVAFEGRDDFLAHAVAHGDGQPRETASVKDLIKFYAIQMGAVHYGPKDDGSLLSRIAGSAEPFLRQTLTAVGRVAHRALLPMADAIILASKDHPFGLVIPNPASGASLAE
ncbi:hypothetical protein [Microlunatus sp. GCM10028923]|uniref:hypothetical protein n=1 Tax=Microlunatus sp. GCM10028923 TaxID=3273400 RepID=UPI003670F68C